MKNKKMWLSVVITIVGLLALRIIGINNRKTKENVMNNGVSVEGVVVGKNIIRSNIGETYLIKYTFNALNNKTYHASYHSNYKKDYNAVHIGETYEVNYMESDPENTSILVLE